MSVDDTLIDMNRMLGNIDGKVDGIQERMDRHDAEHSGIDDKLEGLQADVNKAKGAKAMIGIMAGAIGAASALATKWFGGSQ